MVKTSISDMNVRNMECSGGWVVKTDLDRWTDRERDGDLSPGQQPAQHVGVHPGMKSAGSV